MIDIVIVTFIYYYCYALTIDPIAIHYAFIPHAPTHTHSLGEEGSALPLLPPPTSQAALQTLWRARQQRSHGLLAAYSAGRRWFARTRVRAAFARDALPLPRAICSRSRTVLDIHCAAPLHALHALPTLHLPRTPACLHTHTPHMASFALWAQHAMWALPCLLPLEK